MARQINRKALWVIIIAVGVVVAILIGWLVGTFSGDNDPDGEDHSRGQISPNSETEATPSFEEVPPSSGESGFSTSTQDYLGREVLEPNNPLGESLGEVRDVTSGTCSEGEKGSAADVSIQGTLPATLWSTEDGPSKLDNGVPTGYSKSPRGGVLAAWNYWVLTNRTDDVGWEVLDNHLELTEEESESIDSEPRTSEPVDPESPSMKQIAPTAYKVTSCSDDYIVFDVARSVDYNDSGERLSDPEYVSLRMAVVWKDGDWKLQMSSIENSPLAVEDIDGWAKWNF